MHYLSDEQILFLHARLIEATGGIQGVQDLNKLSSALGKFRADLDHEGRTPDLFTKAAALMEILILNHPVTIPLYL